MNDWLFLLIFLIGILALILEIFVTPGFGVIGFCGIAFVGWSILLAAKTGTQAIEALVLAMVISIAGILLAIKVMAKKGTWHKLILGQKLSNDEGYVTSKEDLADCIGAVGISVTPLRPAGIAIIKGIRLDVVTEGSFIPLNSKIKVIKVSGRRVVVKEVEE